MFVTPVCYRVGMADTSYVTVLPAAPRSGWLAASKSGCSIRHERLSVSIHDREAARAEAARLYPGLLVWVAGDSGPKPWEQ